MRHTWHTVDLTSWEEMLREDPGQEGQDTASSLKQFCGQSPRASPQRLLLALHGKDPGQVSPVQDTGLRSLSRVTCTTASCCPAAPARPSLTSPQPPRGPSQPAAAASQPLTRGRPQPRETPGRLGLGPGPEVGAGAGATGQAAVAGSGGPRLPLPGNRLLASPGTGSRATLTRRRQGAPIGFPGAALGSH